VTLDKATKNMLFDIRLMERNLKNGSITQKEYQEFLKTLPDCSANIDIVNLGPSLDSKANQHPH
jgi:hypothetical protein